MKKNDRLKAWIKLNLVPGIGPVLAKRLFEFLGSPEAVFEASFDELTRVGGISSALAGSIKNSSLDRQAEGCLKFCGQNNIGIIAIDDLLYPAALKHIYDPPPVLYCKGKLLQEDAFSIAIVGTRHASLYGKSTAEKFAYELAYSGVTIISGLARGIDTSAHKGALKAGGRTIAVLGCGIDKVYPRENAGLIKEIENHGAVITEFPPGTEPLKSNFPARNRIISGLSLGVVVVEAALKSGSLITADLALEQNREVFSVPGKIDSFLSQGTLNLIKEGAKTVCGVNDILCELNLDNMRKKDEGRTSNNKHIKKDRAGVLGFIANEPRHIDDIKNAFSLRAEAIHETLLKLELKGLIKRLPGKMYVKS